MTKLSEELNVPPKRRITIPEGSVAVALPAQLYAEVIGICKLIRRGKKLSPEEKKAMHDIAGDLLLALIESENGL